MVIPGSTAVLASGVVAAIAGGLPLLGPIQGGSSWLFVALLIFIASARNEVTPGLGAAFADPVVVRSHWADDPPLDSI